MRTEIKFTMMAIHHAHPRILQSPIATARVTRPSRRRTPPRMAANPAIHVGNPAAANATPPRAATPMSPIPAIISASPASPDRIERIVTPSGRLGGTGAYAPGGGIGGGIVPADGA